MPISEADISRTIDRARAVAQQFVIPGLEKDDMVQECLMALLKLSPERLAQFDFDTDDWKKFSWTVMKCRLVDVFRKTVTQRRGGDPAIAKRWGPNGPIKKVRINKLKPHFPASPFSPNRDESVEATNNEDSKEQVKRQGRLLLYEHQVHILDKKENDPALIAERNDELEVVHKLIPKISATNREAFELTLKGFNPTDISRILGVPPATVHERIGRATAFVKRRLALKDSSR